MVKKIKKILIANRGEIACRIMRSAVKMGIIPIAVYSEADIESLHVLTAKKLGGEAYLIGPAASAQSYLNIDAILKACQESGADAVHPGYGFLSENAKFCAALETAGIIFIGPPTNAIEAMGDKIESKKLAEKAKVSTVPGYLKAITDGDEAVIIANKIGYPVMLKASAGGGGKGMRLAYNDAECRSGLQAAINEGQASFGDGRVFIEKFIEEPRHIEIQILGDQHGNIVYLGERECSMQRRHQKVIEEAPSPFLDAKTRKAMGEEAVSLAKAVGYYSAGTVEFIVDKHKNFFFLEMNTRLQVEHPVTEIVTNKDLVAWMIKIAAGEALDFTQKDVKIEGWAIEARIYAEDSTRGFLPSTGRLRHYQEPTRPEGFVRVDTGCQEGTNISMHYDPMIAKLICHGDNRAKAIQHLRLALDDYLIKGVGHNIPFLSHLLRQSYFLSGEIHTGLIGTHYPEGLSAEHMRPEAQDKYILATAFLSFHEAAKTIKGLEELELVIFAKDEISKANTDNMDGMDEVGEYPISIKKTNDGLTICFLKNGKSYHLVHAHDGAFLSHRFALYIDGALSVFQQERKGVQYLISHDGAKGNYLPMPSKMAYLQRLMLEHLPPDLSQFLLSPMPGLLTKLFVNIGDQVKEGQELAIVEAMKMENMLYAQKDGEIAEICTDVGNPLSVDQIILKFV